MGEARRGVWTSPEEGRGRLRGGQRFPDGAWSLARWEASVLLLPAHKPTPALLSLAVRLATREALSCVTRLQGSSSPRLRLVGEDVCCARDKVHVLPLSGTS
ncbi:hypothetical protein E2C01_075512 [Portunus trituberculatus]|uniref:Uncharacterized protein n=1 Tax=Portunus trituberculatus TaxID=210409 RepID=A0A5B7IF86_PORTR|nr:hypothetical protein [Portunus trituberculatus]